MSSPVPVADPIPSASSSGRGPSDIDKVRHSKPGDLHGLGQNQETILYHGDDVLKKSVDKEEEEDDDSFFEVTLDDVKSMFKDLQRRREELEGAPLKGQKLRALEKETAILKSLHDHPNTAVRIRFPDRFVLQGIFRTSETIGNIKIWLKEFLLNSEMEFYLFTAPPKKVLSDDAKLVDEGLVAMVVMYFGSQAMPADNRVLRKDLYSKISDPEKAFELAKSKLKVRKRDGETDDEEAKPSTQTQPRDHSQSHQPHTSTSTAQPVRRSVDKGKVPKWFKMK